MRPFLVFGLMFFFNTLLFAANPPGKDSLLQIWKDEDVSTMQRLKAMEMLIEVYYNGVDADTMELYGHHLFDMATQHEEPSMQGKGLEFMSTAAFLKGDFNRADSLMNQAEELFVALNDTDGMATVYNSMGRISHRKGNFEEAKEQYQKAIQLWEEIGKVNATISPIINLAGIYEVQGDLRSSLQLNKKAVAMSVEAGQLKNEGVARNNLANNYKFLGDTPNAAEQYLKALAIDEELGDLYSKVGTLNNLGLLYKNNKDFDSALKYINQANELAKQVNSVESKAMSLSNLGAVYTNQGNYQEAIKAFKGTLEMLYEYQIFFMVPYHELEIGNAYLALNQLDSAELYLFNGLESSKKVGRNDDILSGNLLLSKFYSDRGDLNKALSYARQGLEIAQLSEQPGKSLEFTNQLVDLYKVLGNDKELATTLELQIGLKDSLVNEENTRSLIRQETQYFFDKKAYSDSLKNAAKLELQASDLKRRRALNWSLGGILLLLALFGGILVNRYRIIQQQKKQIQEEKNKTETANAKLRELDEAKSRFFTNISHEFRTPLTVIVGITDQVVKYPEKWLTKGGNLIKNNAFNLLNMVNQILDLRKLEAGSLQTQFIQADVSKYLRYILESFHSLAESKGVQLSFQASNEPLILDYDAEKMQRILSNLLTNALKFTPNEGTVTLELNAQPESTPPFYQFEVRDTGVGIPESKLPYIFDRFYQVGETSASSGEGTGIGLALVKELVELLQGRIEVESEEGVGSAFKVTFPITNQAPLELDTTMPESAFIPVISDKISKQASSPKLGSSELPSLLLVEDNPDVMEYLIACLEGQYRLSFAYDGQEGIEKALEIVPDIIISDVMMPLVDGFTLCNTLKTDERTSHIPIVLLTAKADMDSRIEGLEKGADAYLAKPFDRRELEVQLKNLLEIRKRLQDRYSSMELPPPTKDQVFQQEDQFVQRIRDLVLENLDKEKFGVPELCKAAAMSRTQLHNKIKSLTNRSTSHFMRAIRVQAAKELLQQDDLNISEIAIETGFSSRSYFYQVFAEETGISPKKYRENYHSEQ